MSSWNSYGKIYAIGHRAASRLFEGEVTIEEKVDGSQFSFGVFDGEIKVRSRGREFPVDENNNMFSGACLTVMRLAEECSLVDGYTYRGEVLKGPKHNVLCYDRAPVGNIIIFDVAVGDQDYLSYEDKQGHVVDDLGLEVVPLLFKGVVTGQHQLDELKGRTSILGGTPIEGYVVKAYDKLTRDGKICMGKWVSEAFKEVHRKNYSPGTPKPDIAQRLARKYKTEARWAKAVQHRAEAGELLGGPEDIGPLIGMVSKDLHAECIDEIKQDLFDEFWKGLQRSCAKGLAQWYKNRLEAQAFPDE